MRGKRLFIEFLLLNAEALCKQRDVKKRRVLRFWFGTE